MLIYYTLYIGQLTHTSQTMKTNLQMKTFVFRLNTLKWCVDAREILGLYINNTNQKQCNLCEEYLRSTCLGLKSLTI